MYQGAADNPGNFSWTARWLYYCGVNKPLQRDPECGNGAYPSGEERTLSLGFAYTRRFEANVNSGKNYPLFGIITRFSTGAEVILKFRGWDTCLSASAVKLCTNAT